LVKWIAYVQNTLIQLAITAQKQAIERGYNNNWLLLLRVGKLGVSRVYEAIQNI